MKIKHFSLLTSVLITLFSCDQPQPTAQTAAESTQHDTAAKNEQPAINNMVTKSFVANYSGTIDGKYTINVELIKFRNTLGGSYNYKGKTTSLVLKGSMETTGEFILAEYTQKGEETGRFEGKLQGEQLTGTWSNAKRTKSMPFTLTRTAVASLQTKSDVMSDAIGQYKLTYLGGVAGANTMFDTYLENGTWKSNGSSISGGMREGYTNTLAKEDIDLLNNIHIKVDDHRTVHVYAGLIELVKCPFKASGIEYQIEETDKTKMNLKISALSPETIFMNDRELILLANDHIDFSEIIKGEFNSVMADNMILSYYPAERKFDLHIFLGSCCDGNILTFKKD